MANSYLELFEIIWIPAFVTEIVKGQVPTGAIQFTTTIATSPLTTIITSICIVWAI